METMRTKVRAPMPQARMAVTLGVGGEAGEAEEDAGEDGSGNGDGKGVGQHVGEDAGDVGVGGGVADEEVDDLAKVAHEDA